MIRRHDVRRLHTKGDRPLFELLVELDAACGSDFVERRVRAYVEIDDAALNILDARHLPRSVLHEVAA